MGSEFSTILIVPSIDMQLTVVCSSGMLESFFLNSIVSLSIFFVGSSDFLQRWSRHLWIKIDWLLISSLNVLIYCVIVLARTSSACFVPDVRGRTFSLSLLRMLFLYIPLIRKCFLLNLLRVLFCLCVWIRDGCQMLFCFWDYRAFSMVSYTDWMLNQPFIPAINPTS